MNIYVSGITVGYGKEIILEKLSFSFEGPGLIQILGPNGAGKSTLLKTIIGLIKPIEGHIVINNEDVTGDPRRAGKYVGYVPQVTSIQETYYPVTLKELVECCYLLKKKWPRLYISKDEEKMIEDALLFVGLPRSVWNKCFWDLSGGQKQRGYIARALVSNPDILLMDEPFSNIDPNGKMDLAERISRLSKRKLIIVTSHDPMLLLKYTNKILLLNRRIYIYGDPHEVLSKEVAEKIYGKALIEVKEHLHIIDSHF